LRVPIAIAESYAETFSDQSDFRHGLLAWSTQSVQHARVYVVTEGSSGREEKLFSGSRTCAKCDAPWIEKNTYTFTLYDYSTGNRGRTLATVSVTGTPTGSASPSATSAEHSGTISASPNPCVIERGQKACTTHLTWSSQGVQHARVYVVAQGSRGREENLFSGSRTCEKCDAPWIEKNTYTFTLYDYSTENRGRALATVTVIGTQAK
jgi:hypothetical protein